ncbi:hypothetical protein GJAV_G00156990 [Gymnothorax javanicus]|nr:hypothetical protein GJAV_G00156990 [Gymnothorax javanicus]
MPRVCAYPRCFNRMKRRSRVSFHKLPVNNPEMLKLWITAMNLKATANLSALRVCSEHFSLDDYFCEPGTEREKHRLRSSAVPMVFSRSGEDENVGAVGGMDPAPVVPSPDKDTVLDVPIQDDIMRETEKVRAGLPQSTPVQQRDTQAWTSQSSARMKLFIISPRQPVLHTKPSTSGIYYAFPPLWTQSRVRRPAPKMAYD